ncbi:MAG: C40 family peptidase [Exiguobacterium sp.]|nr:C40 family peptidase [Exiguobacterium sp.]
MKRICSLLLLFTFYWTLSAHAVGSEAVLRVGTTLYADPEESIILLVTTEPELVEIHQLTDTHASVTVDSQTGFVRNEALVYAATRYVQEDTNSFDAAGNPVAPINLGTTVHVYDLDEDRLFMKDGTYIVRNVLGEQAPESVIRYAKQGAVLLSSKDGDIIAQVEAGQTLKGFITGDFLRVETTNGYRYVRITSTSVSPIKTGSRYAQTEISVYQDTDKKRVIGSLKRGQLVSTYGKIGNVTRIDMGGRFAYVETALLGTKEHAPLKTGQRYITKDTPIYARTSLSSKTTLTLKRGQLINVYGTKGGYTRIFTKGKYYFVPTSVTSTKKPPQFESTGMRYSRYNGVEVYASTSVTKQVASLKRGQVVETFGTSGYYTRIRLNGTYRYVATGYLAVSKPTAKPKAGTVFYTQFNGTPYFSADVAYGRPAGTLPRGTKLVGLRSIDADFWHVRLSSGKRVYVLNPYIAETKPKAVQPASVYTAAHYGTTKKTPFYANPNDTRPIGYLDAGRRIYPRGKSGDSYLIQYDWRPVYVKTTDIRIKQDTLLKKRGNSQKERLIASAVKHLGTPYTWGSQSPLNGGFDCSGLIHYAANQAGKVGGRTNVSGYWHSGHFKHKRTNITSGHRGDIVFFAGTYRSGPSHIGIMLDDEFFIHAGGEMLQINSIHDPMWRPYFLGYKSL